MDKKIIAFVFIALLVGVCIPLPGSNPGFIPIVSGGGVTDHGALNGLGDDDHSQYILHTELDSEAEFESHIVGVTNFWNDNDFADNSANWNTAFGWGDHSTQNYFDTDTDLLDEPLLDCDNAPTDEYVLTYESSTGNFEWQQDQTGAGGGPSMAFHNHNQDLNDTATPSFPDIYVEDALYHKGDLDTNFLFTTDNIKLVVGGVQLVEIANSILKVKDSTDVYVHTESTGVDSHSGYDLENDARKWRIEVNGSQSDKFYIRDETVDKFPFVIEGGTSQNAMIYLANSGYVDIAGANPGYRLELPNTASTAGRGRANQWPVYSDKRFKFDFSKLPKNETLLLCRLIDWRVYKPIENWQDENGTIYMGDVTSSFSIGAYAQPLYWDIINAFGNNSKAYKIAESIVYKPIDESKDYWGVDFDTIGKIYARGWQILDELLQENIEHTKNLESWAESLDDLLPTAYEFEPIPWN